MKPGDVVVEMLAGTVETKVQPAVVIAAIATEKYKGLRATNHRRLSGSFLQVAAAM